MNALIDTHVFVWMVTDPTRVTPTMRNYLADPDYTIYLSVASVWELVIKAATGKLSLGRPVADSVAQQLAENPLKLLTVSSAHALRVAELPLIHRDPFDRMLVAQALVEDAVLLTVDPDIRQYPVRTDW